MRVAALADIHGNLPALRAVLADVDDERADVIVIAGDVVGGAYPREVLELLADRHERLVWIRGNSEREAVAAWDGAPTADDEPGRAATWSARALDREWRDELASWPISAAVDGVRYCHGSPRRDDEVLTRLTPDAALRQALDHVTESVVVGGHTHQQVIRRVTDGLTYVNAGSVGMPYEGRPGAFWLLLQDGQPRLRETGYDIGAAVAELRASGFDDIDSQLAESLLEPVDGAWVAAFFEHAAGRGPDPGPPPPHDDT
ncbi:MAG TPA: YfcE family phosphodiesterase [Solirubrobacteraceae bacterium]|nr:YfcE family phosphodiesterase [Solirubrobacteraceae bacterium]